MKKILYIMSAVLLMAGCTKTELENDQRIGSQDVVLSVSPDLSYGDGTMEPMDADTRTGGTVTVNNYVLEVYTKSDYSDTPARTTNTSGNFKLTLDRTKEYYCLLWADNDNTNYNTENLKAVTLNSGKRPIEAFFGKTTIGGASATLSVTLKRAVAKINLCDKNGMEAGKSVNLKYSYLPTFNTVTGTVSGEAVAQDYSITSVASAAGESFGSFWMLAPAGASSTLDLTFKVEDEAETTTVTDITYQANYLTNIKGKYVEPSVKVGDYYYDDNTYSTTYNSSKTAIGIVFWVDPTDATKYKIVSLNERQGRWGASGIDEQSAGVVGIRSNANGKTATKNLIALRKDDADFATNYYAFNFAYLKNDCDVNGPWYLPAKDELKAIYTWWNTDISANNLIITTAGGTGLTAGTYWSATEKDDTRNAWYVSFRNSSTDASTKSNGNRVRLVRDIK